MNLTNSSNKKSWKALCCQVSTLNFNIAGPGLQSQLWYFIIVNSSFQDTMVKVCKKYEKLFLLLSNYWMRLSMISWIIKTKVWGSIICDIMGQPNSIIVLLYIFQTAKEDTFLWVCLSMRTLHRWGAWKLGRLWSQHDECNIHLRYCICSGNFTHYCTLIECSNAQSDFSW